MGAESAWEWNSMRKCWERGDRRAYPFEDGHYSISEDECWIEGSYVDFDAACFAFTMDPERLHHGVSAKFPESVTLADLIIANYVP